MFFAPTLLYGFRQPHEEISLYNKVELQCACYCAQKFKHGCENSVQHTGVFMDVTLTLSWVFSNPLVCIRADTILK